MCKALALNESIRKVQFERITNILFSNMFLFARKQNVYTCTLLSFDSEHVLRGHAYLYLKRLEKIKCSVNHSKTSIYHRIVIENRLIYQCIET